jgi:hypothetical protein
MSPSGYMMMHVLLNLAASSNAQTDSTVVQLSTTNIACEYSNFYVSKSYSR